MSTKSTLIFVPGAWHDRNTWANVAQILEKQGHATVLLQLPSVGANPVIHDFQPDVDTIRAAIHEQSDKGQYITLVTHSYGGIPSTQAVQGLDIKSRKDQGLTGGVKRIVYCCSFMIPEGESLHSYFGGHDLPWYLFNEDRSVYYAQTPEIIFYNDMAPAAQEEAARRLQPHSFKAITTPLTYAGWKHIPSTYIYCEQDNAIPIQIQKRMVEETAKGYDVRTETLNASHSPFYSMPEETAAAIQRAVELVES